MEFQNVLSDNEYTDCYLWSEYSYTSSSSDLPSSPNSTNSEKSLPADDNCMCEITSFVGSKVTVMFDNSTDSGDNRFSEISNSVINVFPHWVDLQESFQNKINLDHLDTLSPYNFKDAEWCSETKLASCFEISKSLTSSQITSEKPKRKRSQSKLQRKAANVRERKRMLCLNDAFDSLRKHLPSFSYEKTLSRTETLKLAIKYICFMKDITSSVDN